jgi:iron-sulfur cluster assembly protein
MRSIAAIILIGVCLAGCTDREQKSAQTVATSSKQNVSHDAGGSASESRVTRRVVQLTAAAVAKIREVKEGTDATGIRVAVVGGGRTGFQYDLKLESKVDQQNDYVDQFEGILVAVDKRSALYLEGATIDWIVTREGASGFHFDNPNARPIEK